MGEAEEASDSKPRRPMSSKLAERAAMFAGTGTSPSQSVKKEPIVTAGGGVKARLAAMKEQETRSRAHTTGSTESPPVPGGGVKARLAALKAAGGSPIMMGPRPPATQESPEGGGIKARLAALKAGGGVPMMGMPGMVATTGGPGPSSLRNEKEEDTPKKELEEHALKRATIHSKRRTKTVKKQDFDGLVQAIEERPDAPAKEDTDSPPPPPPLPKISTPTTPADEWVKHIENDDCHTIDPTPPATHQPPETEEQPLAADTAPQPAEPRGSVLSAMLGF